MNVLNVPPSVTARTIASQHNSNSDVFQNLGSVMSRLYDILGITASERDLKRRHNITKGKKKVCTERSIVRIRV